MQLSFNVWEKNDSIEKTLKTSSTCLSVRCIRITIFLNCGYIIK